MSLERLQFGFLALALAAPVSANTYNVDDNGGPGVDFTDIAPAIAFAQAGDVLLVAPGTYSSFVLDKGLVIVGHSASTVVGGFEVRNVVAGPRAVVVDFLTTRFVVDNCAAPVVLQELRTIQTASVSGSPDVRIARTQFQLLGVPSDGLTPFEITNSRVEFVDSRVRGHSGVSSGSSSDGGQGGSGIRLQNSRFVGSKFTTSGGEGSFETQPGHDAGGGGAGILMLGYSTAVFLGAGSDVRGGYPGYNNFYNDCSHDGSGGYAVATFANDMAQVTSSGTFIAPVYWEYGVHCVPITGTGISFGVTLVEPVPAEPSLEASSAPFPGGTLTFTVRGAPGAIATLSVGRDFVVVPVPGVTMETLVLTGRVFQLGAIPASGVIVRSVPLPLSMPQGTVLNAQVRVTGSSGVARTNSTPIVLR
jgi:hypothetical protein